MRGYIGMLSVDSRWRRRSIGESLLDEQIRPGSDGAWTGAGEPRWGYKHCQRAELCYQSYEDYGYRLVSTVGRRQVVAPTELERQASFSTAEQLTPARKLVELAIREMEAIGADEIVLETEYDNGPSLALYEALGFVREKRLHRFYSNGKDA